MSIPKPQSTRHGALPEALTWHQAIVNVGLLDLELWDPSPLKELIKGVFLEIQFNIPHQQFTINDKNITQERK